MEVNNIFSIDGKQGFVTGAARGIGKCLCEALLKQGASVAIVDMDIEEARKTTISFESLYPGRVTAIQCDVTDSNSVNIMMDKYMSVFERLDFAINNAGIANVIAAEDISPSDFIKVIDVNLNGVFLTSQVAARQMIKQGTKGSIVNTASMSGHVINTPQTIANYCASKGGVVMLTKALAVEWAKYGIRVNSVSPGYMATELVAQMKEMHPIWTEKIPAGRLGKPEDLIGAYIYLLSEASSYATGTDLIVDGGYTSL